MHVFSYKDFQRLRGHRHHFIGKRNIFEARRRSVDVVVLKERYFFFRKKQRLRHVYGIKICYDFQHFRVSWPVDVGIPCTNAYTYQITQGFPMFVDLGCVDVGTCRTKGCEVFFHALLI